MSQRLFQHYKGKIVDFNQLEFSTVKAVVDSADTHVLTVWLQNRYNDCWYRLFIDGAYCGVDRFLSDLSSEDLDEGAKIIDYSEWFQGKRILKAHVFTTDNVPYDIILSLKFEKSECQLFYHSRQNECRFKFIN
jgi:hypothetical protein